jgi:thiol-disulfide isomerase/thioredoxin
MTGRLIGVGILSTAIVLLLALSGCTSTGASVTEPSPSDPRYVTNGAVTEIAPADRGKAVTLAGTLDTGEQITAGEWTGKVVVANFWYAGCGPCRAEARDLEAVYTKYQSQGVIFVGVNVRDQAATAKTFAKEFGITYPTFLDVDSGAQQLAFAGKVAPNAVPTTVVIDKKGRVASRVLGQLESQSILQTLIGDALAEGS